MRHLPTILLLVISIISALPAFAKPLKGFNEGPYLYLEGGIVQATYDKNEQTGENIGNDFEPTLGLAFGWNIWDYFSAELEGRYGTNIRGGRREHVVSANANGKFFFILDALTNFKSLRILPTLKGGFSFRVVSLPGDASATDTAVTAFGWGPSFGGGISFIVKKYIFFGFDIQEDLLFFDDTRQNLTINGVPAPDTLVYKGGFFPQFSAMAFIGVHF